MSEWHVQERTTVEPAVHRPPSLTSMVNPQRQERKSFGVSVLFFVSESGFVFERQKKSVAAIGAALSVYPSVA